ncbi:MAG: YhbY family RNA-binding protein [Oscillospiraceae bacterium]|nr:YhbY family RNA-binding protein [Oscillospiraceae bacterium]
MTSKQRARLRALANPLDTLFQIGKGGVSENLLAQLDDLLRARELIKIRVLETAGTPAAELGSGLAEALRAECVQVIGSRIILYRRNPEKKDGITL